MPPLASRRVWGYWLGASMILAGLVVGAVLVFTSINNLIGDVNDLRRTASEDGLEATLQRGAEIFVYDEDGIDAGPFDVRVIRTSDDAVIETQRVDNGPSYDIDGRDGEARVSFDVPTSDIYRIEVDTSVGDIARFAVGGDVGSGPGSRIIRGVVIGAILALIGFLIIVWTSVMHARFRLRTAVLDSVGSARRTVRETAETAPEALADQAEASVARPSAWAEQQLAKARSRLDEAGGQGGLRGQAADAAKVRLEQVDRVLGEVEQTVRDAASTSDAPVDVAAQVDEALARVQQRVEAGDSLRDIARDERVAAAATAEELRVQAEAARAGSHERLRDLEQAATTALDDELGPVTTDVHDIASTALDDIAGQVGDASGALGDQLTGSAEELAVGVAATAGAAATVAAARARDALGVPVERNGESGVTLSSLPPPSSSLPPPPVPPAGSPPPPAPFPAEVVDVGPSDRLAVGLASGEEALEQLEVDVASEDQPDNVLEVTLEADHFVVSDILDEPDPVVSAAVGTVADEHMLEDAPLVDHTEVGSELTEVAAAEAPGAALVADGFTVAPPPMAKPVLAPRRRHPPRPQPTTPCRRLLCSWTRSSLLRRRRCPAGSWHRRPRCGRSPLVNRLARRHPPQPVNPRGSGRQLRFRMPPRASQRANRTIEGGLGDAAMAS